jgi:arylsulfatase A-like enzyme
MPQVIPLVAGLPACAATGESRHKQTENNMNHSLRLFATLLAAWIASPLASAGPAGTTQAAGGDRRPNIILVMSDDHGHGDCGFTGHPFVKTPHLDDMARNAVVFKNFHAAAPVCSPTRASVLTGRHPFRANVPNHGHYMRPDELTIAEVLRDAGYVTGHFGKWHIGSVQAESPTSPGGAGFDEWLTGLNFFDIDPYLSRNGIYERDERSRHGDHHRRDDPVS